MFIGPDERTVTGSNGADVSTKQIGLHGAKVQHPYEIVLCYRDNPQYREHLPEIKRRLVHSGYKVSIRIFPERSTESEIAESLLLTPEEVNKKILITDQTVKRTLERIGANLNDDLEHPGQLRGALDSCFNVGASQAFLKRFNIDDIKLQYHVTRPQAEKIFVALLSDALTNAYARGEAPDRVVLFANRLHDHGPFCNEDSAVISSREMYLLEISDPAAYRTQSLRYGMIVKDWLRKAIEDSSLPADKIPVVDLVFEPYDVLDLEITRSESIWCIGDAHLSKAVLEDIRRADLLLHPELEDLEIEVGHLDDDDFSFFDEARKDPKSEYELALRYKVAQERALERELRAISRDTGGHNLRVQAVMKLLGLDYHKQDQSPLRAGRAANKLHLQLPLSYLIKNLEDHNLLTPAPTSGKEADMNLIMTEIATCISREEKRLQQVA